MRHERLQYSGPRSFFFGENSFLIEPFDPLIQGGKGKTDILLDRYFDYRLAAGRPVSRQEILDAVRYAKGMGGYGDKVARSIAARRVLRVQAPLVESSK